MGVRPNRAMGAFSREYGPEHPHGREDGAKRKPSAARRDWRKTPTVPMGRAAGAVRQECLLRGRTRGGRSLLGQQRRQASAQIARLHAREAVKARKATSCSSSEVPEHRGLWRALSGNRLSRVAHPSERARGRGPHFCVFVIIVEALANPVARSHRAVEAQRREGRHGLPPMGRAGPRQAPRPCRPTAADSPRLQRPAP